MKPRERVLSALKHQEPYHCCGAMWPFIPDLIQLGVDILDPIQPVSPEMQPEPLKAEFGGHICFHGGIDMQCLLPNAMPEQVAAQVLRYCEVLGAGGGYILAPAHLFQPDVPSQNILVYRQKPIAPRFVHLEPKNCSES